jgi:glycosyltransferase involved in cell wall biosynthesis
VLELSVKDESVAGYCDGVKGAEVYGWAWRPDYPDKPVDIELWVDGVLAGSTTASLYRPDLRAAGVGHGRYGWRLPLPANPAPGRPQKIVARVKDGDLLQDGEFDYSDQPMSADLENAEFQAFVAAALGRGGTPDAEELEETTPPINFLLYSAGSPTLGAAEYSYGFVLKAFRPLLERLGRVHLVEDPVAEADELHATHIARGETSLLLSFAPPHRTPLGLRCPTVPVIAWEFPTIPDRVWDEDRRHDWRFVLRQTGRAITLSRFAAEAVRAAMGAEFPVAAIPAPVWDRFPELQTLGPPRPGAEISVKGFVFDTRGRTFEPAAPTPPLPFIPAQPDQGEPEAPSSAVLDGVVFTAVFSPKDGRKNWPDILWSFVTAHRETPEATLVLKMVGADANLWWWELHDSLGKLPDFACRVLVIQGYMDQDQYNGLIAASHWVANASHAEGLCLPLLEFMSAGRPAVAPSHTAMSDYVDASNALVLESDEEFCSWPHDPRMAFTATRHRLSWPSLVAAFAEAYRLTREDPERYAALAAGARDSMARYCADDVVAARLDAFLGLSLGLGPAIASPLEIVDAAA